MICIHSYPLQHCSVQASTTRCFDQDERMFNMKLFENIKTVRPAKSGVALREAWDRNEMKSNEVEGYELHQLGEN